MGGTLALQEWEDDGGVYGGVRGRTPGAPWTAGKISEVCLGRALRRRGCTQMGSDPKSPSFHQGCLKA